MCKGFWYIYKNLQLLSFLGVFSCNKWNFSIGMDAIGMDANVMYYMFLIHDN